MKTTKRTPTLGEISKLVRKVKNSKGKVSPPSSPWIRDSATIWYSGEFDGRVISIGRFSDNTFGGGYDFGIILTPSSRVGSFDYFSKYVSRERHEEIEEIFNHVDARNWKKKTTVSAQQKYGEE